MTESTKAIHCGPAKPDKPKLPLSARREHKIHFQGGACASLPSHPLSLHPSWETASPLQQVARPRMGKPAAQHTMGKPTKCTHRLTTSQQESLLMLNFCFLLPLTNQLPPTLLPFAALLSERCKCLVHNSCRTTFRLMIFCSLAGSLCWSPLPLASNFFQSIFALLLPPGAGDV